LRGALATKRSILLYDITMLRDGFAEPVIGRRFAPTRWLAMTIFWLFENLSPSSPRTRGPITPVGCYDARRFNKVFGMIRNIDGTAYGSPRARGRR
jgi:hypothetical protein